MREDKKYREARAWFYTFKTERGFHVESRTGAVLHVCTTWDSAAQWAMHNLSKIDDHEKSKG